MKMNDAISRQAAIDAIKSYWTNEVDRIPESTDFDVFTQICDSIVSHNANICKAIDKLPSAQPEQRWIPCSERLPDKEGIYLCTVGADYRNPREMIYAPDNVLVDEDMIYAPVNFLVGEDSNTWRSTDGHRVFNWFVIAWMPMPEPYKTDKGSGIDEN